MREWAKKNPDLAKAQARRMYESNREAVKKKAAEWAAANRERRREVSAASARRLRAQDPERFRAKARQRRQDPAVRLHESISEQIRQSLRGRKAGASWESLLGYSLHDLVRHLSALFQDGMSMDNYGEWHIDHKRPVASFDFTRPTDEDFAACWALSNLQPLWARENMQKSSTWNGVRHVRRRAHREAPENVAHARAPEVK